MQPLKAGIFHLARWFPDVCIVPVWIDYAHLGMPSVGFGTAIHWKADQSREAFLMELKDALEAARRTL